MKQMTAFCLTLMMVITMALSPALEAAAAVSAPLLAYSFEAQEDLDAFSTKRITQVNSGNNGSGALKWTSGGSKSRTLAGQEQVTIQTGKYYYASVYVKHGAATALNFTLQTNFKDFAKGDFSYERTTNTGKFVYGSTVSDWNDCEQLLKVYSIPSSNEFTRIWLLFKVNALYDS
ncbi:MAG: hypothetical protein SO147_02590, partial [Clostridia bacterium]|nr:hypothetical protein [Clostridia bacterium]